MECYLRQLDDLNKMQHTISTIFVHFSRVEMLYNIFDPVFSEILAREMDTADPTLRIWMCYMAQFGAEYIKIVILSSRVVYASASSITRAITNFVVVSETGLKL